MLQIPSNDLRLKDFEQLSLGENELLKSIVSNEKGIKMLTALSNSQQFIKWLQHNGKHIAEIYHNCSCIRTAS